MSGNIYGDPEARNDSADGHHDQLSQREPNFGDSSGKLFSIYSDAAKDEDDKMVERWQKDADAILIFTGLFSAAVAALLALTVQDLRPNSQDTSAFYLGNIYGVLADPNATRASPIAKPPPFSRPRYSVWVNSLWFLSLVMSLSCALWATSLHQWARRYIRLTQPARCSPEKRARMRAFFANGVEEMHIPWAVEGLPTLLHLSLFLFFWGLAIFLFNVDREVFTSVIWWIVLFSIVYVLITLLPLIRKDSPYYSPLSVPALFLCTSIPYVAFTILTYICGCWNCCDNLIERYRGWMFGGVERMAEEKAAERSLDIDAGIFGWTIGALGDDDSLEKFFEAIPGFFSSKLVGNFREHLPENISRRLSDALYGFLSRTLTSNSVVEKVKLHRLDIATSVMNLLPVSAVSSILGNIFFKHRDQLSQNVEIGHALVRYCTSNNQYAAWYAQRIVARILTTVQERDGRWVALAASVYGLSEHDVREYVAHGDDSVTLAILIQFTRKVFRFDSHLGVSVGLTGFDIRNTLSRLQHDFCTLWNDLVQEAKSNRTTPVFILRRIRHLYIALHQGTDAAPTAFSSIQSSNDILFRPSSYPLCNIASHRRHSIAHPPVPVPTQSAHSPVSPQPSPGHSTSGRTTVSWKVQEQHAITGAPLPSHPMTLSEIRDGSLPPATASPASPIYTRPPPTDASPPPGAVFAAPQDIRTAATLSHPLEGITKRDAVVPCTEPDILFASSMTAPTPTLSSMPASKQPVLNKSSESYDTGAAHTSNPGPLLPSSSVISFSFPTSSPQSCPPPPPIAESLSFLSSATPPRPSGDAALPRLRVCGLVNTGNMCFANAVLQLLVHSPPFWNMFRASSFLKGRNGVGGRAAGGGATPLADATVRLFEEFVVKENELLPMHQPQQQVAGGKPREYEDGTKELTAVDPMYMYDAMKEKRRLETFMDGQQHDAEEFFCLYLDSLDEELLAPLTSIHKSGVAPGVEECEVSQSGLTDVGRRSLRVELIESSLMRIFGGKFRLTVRAPGQPDAVTTEEWRSLRLDIQHDSVQTVDDALARISHLQPVQLGPSGRGASQQVLIEALPSILVLHLKRFLYDTATNGINKISKPILFAPELEIPLDIMTPIAGKSAEPVHYKLYGVLYHCGKSAGSGHYTVDVLHPNGDSGNGEGWLHIDDEVVSTVRNEDVFGGSNNERADERCAYMLFYCRTAPTQT